MSGSGRAASQGELALLGGLLQSMPGSVAYVAGPDLVFQFANEEYQRIVGERELIGRPLREALPELAPERVAMVERAVRHGQPFEGRESEVWIRRRGEESEQMFVDFAYQPVPDGAGGVAGVLLYGHDVTAHVRDRRRLEELAARLAESEERYRTLFETLPSGVMYYSADGSIIGANPAARRILGFELPELTRWPLPTSGKAIHEDGSPVAREDFPLVKALRTGEIVADVVMGVPHARTGELRWLRVTAVPDARDTQGRPQRAYAIMADITGQRRAEAALRQSSRLLGRLREANVLGVAVASEEGVQEANDAYLDIIGYTRADLDAGRVSWRALTPPQWAVSDEDAVGQLRRTGACQPYEKEHVHRDGHRVPVLVGAAVIGWHPLRWATFVVDLTARQRAEEERAALLGQVQAARKEADTARDRLAFLLQAGDLVAATDSGGDLLEQVSQLVDVAVTGADDRVISGRDASEARRAHAALRAINAELEERVRRRTSELMRAEADRRALEAELQQAERMQTVGELTSGIAHDFGNLLSIIVGYAEMAEDVTEGDRDLELHRILTEIRSAADRAVRLSSDLIQFSRRAQATPEEINLNELIAGARDLLTVSMNGRAEVNFQPSVMALPAVLAGRAQLEQVLLNLAVNARDAMPAGGTLTIATSVTDFDEERARLHPGTRPGRYVELAVQDTGMGMNADVQARIFERFFTTKPAGRGAGLGLSTVHGIVTGLGGAVEVRSVEGHGTTFRIYLPTVHASAADTGGALESALP